ncbi:hypothetical protein QUB63_01445 [Microcoleus sp. ARI1-B5]|uniref:hypothetical protein n=1 Tax=unclassified Microcoleus TaxID=2642155 RepID=UPI002FD51DAD
MMVKTYSASVTQDAIMGRSQRVAFVVRATNILLHIYKLALCGLRDRTQTKNAFYTPKEAIPNHDEGCDRAHGF